jgi:hypothetical protein
MVTARVLCLILAAVCFLLAAKPPAGVPVRWEWLGVLFIVLSWLIGP